MTVPLTPILLALAVVTAGCANSDPSSLTDEGISTAAATATPAAFRVIRPGALTTCALAENGRPFCWGFNQNGQVGDGTTQTRLLPTSLAGGHRFVDLAVGNGHACDLKPTGSVYCWGYNLLGSLGDGTNIDRLTPVASAAGLQFRSITAKQDNTCGLTTGNLVYCWGFGVAGRTPNPVLMTTTQMASIWLAGTISAVLT